MSGIAYRGITYRKAMHVVKLEGYNECREGVVKKCQNVNKRVL